MCKKETYKSTYTKINYLTRQSMIFFGLAFKNIDNEEFVANIVVKIFCLEY